MQVTFTIMKTRHYTQGMSQIIHVKGDSNMFTVEVVVKEIKGVEKRIKGFFGVGRLVSAPPELRTAGTHQVLSGKGFSLACDAGKDEAGNKKTEYFSLKVWDKTAANFAKYAVKGQELQIFGRIDTESYEDRTTKEEKTREVLVVDRFELGRKPKSSEAGNQPQTEQKPETTNATRNAPVQAATPEMAPEVENDNGFDDEDIPF